MPTTIIGHVVHIRGAVEVRAVDGTIKLLSLGDNVHQGEVVMTAPTAEIKALVDELVEKRLLRRHPAPGTR